MVISMASVFFFFIFFSFCPLLVSSCDQNDQNALLSFALSLSNASISSAWSPRISCCQWEGVHCTPSSSSSRVTELRLPDRNLTGPISPSLANLTHLQLLSLRRNALWGPLAVLADMPALRVVDISSNRFNATVRDLGSSLLNLSYFNASNNSLSGSLTDICFGSGSLRVLDLSKNSLSGELTDFSNCGSSLQELYLGSNSLSGALPDSLFDSFALETLSVPFNDFSGRFGDNLSNLSSIKNLVLYGNRFSGPIPDVFGNLTTLEHLIAHSNSFSGELPKSLSLCSSLKELDLRNNSLTGRLDIDFEAMPLLTTLDLASNHLTGHLPVSLSNCRQLKMLSLAKNGFSGEIPYEFKNLESLSFLSLSNNTFRNISGALSSFQECKNLSTLILTKNFHGEEIPKLPTGFENLAILALGNCALHGEIPKWLVSCKKLQVLDLSWNHFNGTIPEWIGQFESLIYLDISNNSLTGDIPKSLTRLKSLALERSSLNASSIDMPLYVKRNQSVLGLQYNQVSSFPPSLYLNDNRLSGSIWPEFGLLKALHVLDLSNNKIAGEIPGTLADMANLEVLDLSSNDLNGTIPESLTKLTFLSKFSVANNKLEGAVPVGGQFFSFSNASFAGNPALCRAPESCNKTVPVSVSVSKSSNSIGKSSILGITISIGIGITVLLAVLLLNLMKRDMVDAVSDADDEERELNSGSKLVLFFKNENITIGEILKSTNNFDQANIIGCGGFGLVYKAYLQDGTKAAIKRLSGDCGQMEREFRAEVETLSRARHKNLVSLIGYCRYATDRLLIYSYMENGNLDYWLHERADAGLKWDARLKIAQGSARGLLYLHTVCEPNIIHRDVKSSNILLDDKFEAHLADFGLARLIRPYDTHVTTDLVGTLGYIPPEYSGTLTATLKGDVYSFGVVLLELLTGRRPVDVCKGKGCRNLVASVMQMKREGKEEEVFDGVIWSKGKEKELKDVLEIACRCVGEDSRRRPGIEQVVSWLDEVGAGGDCL